MPLPPTQSAPPPALILGFMATPISWAGPWGGQPWATVLPQPGGDGQGAKAELRLEGSLALLAMHTQPRAQPGAPWLGLQACPVCQGSSKTARPPRVLGKQAPHRASPPGKNTAIVQLLASAVCPSCLDAAAPQPYSGPSEPASAGGQPLGATTASPDPHMLASGVGLAEFHILLEG